MNKNVPPLKIKRKPRAKERVNSLMLASNNSTIANSE